MAHQVHFEEALLAYEAQARMLGAAVLLLGQNLRELKDKQAELRNWTRWKRHELFLQSIRRERKALLCERLKIRSRVGLLEIGLERTRADVQHLAKGGKIL